MDIFTIGLILLIPACAVLHFYVKSVKKPINDQNFLRFQRIYLVVYLLAMFGDWLQGPHVYALYESYQMTKHDIEILFIAGFGSSMIFGTIVGSFADKYGRKLNCIIYGLAYGLGCITKHFNNFNVLMFGRLLAGIATSIVYSAFESWLIYEHKQRGFDESSLEDLFANAYFGNSVIAITAGIVAQYAANHFGFVAPFDLSLISLVIMIIFILMTWTENYGDAHADVKKSFITAWESIMSDRKVLYLGLIQSLFESSMYVFVLEWTPSLTIGDTPIPHGFIFASFMVSIMIGSNCFKILTKIQEVEFFMRPVLLLSSLALAIPILFPQNQFLIFFAFILFEICVGIFWPSMGTMRSRYVPETARSTIMNFFRVPLNVIVVIVLLQDLQISTIFSFCVGCLLCAALFQHLLNLSTKPQAKQEGLISPVNK